MKILGALLIIVATVSTAYYYEKKQNLTVSELKNIKKFVDYIIIKIEHISLPLNDIFEKFGLSSKAVVSLSNKERVGLFDKETEDELYNCFAALGTGYKTDEIKRLNLLSDYLTAKIKEYEKVCQEKIKVFRAVAVFVGLSLIIILV